MKPKITESAREIICHELKLPGVHSIILIGSRARGDASAKSDYDLYVVIPIALLPFLFPIIKKKEKSLKEKLKADVSISPLTYSRMKRGKDTLIFHAKKEGVILCGKDIKSKIHINSFNELPKSELYQYLFDTLYYAIEPISSLENRNSKILRAISKAVLSCAYLRLLQNGIYIKEREEIMKITKDPRVKEIYYASIKNQKIQEKLKSPVINHLWDEAKEYLLETTTMMGIDIFNGGNMVSVQFYSEKLEIILKFIIRLIVWFDNKLDDSEKSIIENILKEKNLKTHVGLSAIYLAASVNSVIPLKVDPQKLKKLRIYIGNGYDILDPVDMWIRLKTTSLRLWKILGLKFSV